MNDKIEGKLMDEVWKAYTQEQQELMLVLSIFDLFNSNHLLSILGTDRIDDSVKELLHASRAIAYDPQAHTYKFESGWKHYLRQIFQNERSEGYHVRSYVRVAEAYQSSNQYVQASHYYDLAGRYESIMTMPVSVRAFSPMERKALADLIRRVVERSDRRTLMRFPRTLLFYALELCLNGEWELFAQVVSLLQICLEEQRFLNAAEHIRLSGEMAFVMSLTQFNDIEKMSAYHRKAYNLLNGPMEILDLCGAFTFGVPSVLYMFWSGTGKLNHSVDQMKENLPCYLKLSGGHGSGGDCLMKAEALFAGGDDVSAESLCYKALYLAESQHQDCICFGAQLLLARIAILRGDLAALNGFYEQMRRRMIYGTEVGREKTWELCNAMLGLLTGNLSMIANWLKDAEEIKNRLYAMAVPYALMLYSRILLAQGLHGELLGICEPVLSCSEKLNLVYTKTYQLIYIAMSKLEMKQEDAARCYLLRALSLSGPDLVHMPYAEQCSESLMALIASLGQEELDEGLKTDILNLCHRQMSGVRSIEAAFSPRQFLTHREREIALLARDGMTTKEIALQLYVSSETIKMALKKIFSKLGIKSREQLKDRDIY